MDANFNRDNYGRIGCFNPRARDGRELEVVLLKLINEVSIHAPVMDANGLVSSST